MTYPLPARSAGGLATGGEGGAARLRAGAGGSLGE
jgi:hypothetical protein